MSMPENGKKNSTQYENELQKLKDEPHPSPEAQSGDREKVTVNGEEV